MGGAATSIEANSDTEHALNFDRLHSGEVNTGYDARQAWA